MPRLRDLPESQRPRERLLQQGPRHLADAELLAVLLGTGVKGADALEAAHELVARFGDLRRMSKAGISELSSVPGVGVVSACRVRSALALAGRLAGQPFGRGERVGSPEDVHDRLGRRLAVHSREGFYALALDIKHRILAELRLAEGGVCSVEVLPRDVFARLLREDAVATIFVHNHPSGDPSPSAADEEMTQRLRAAGELLGIMVLDHIIVAQSGYFAFSERMFGKTPND